MTNTQKAELYKSRFRGRTDVYGKARVIEKPDGTTIKIYHPVCEAFWSEQCNIRLKNGKGCSICAAKAYAPVTNESVLKHILGEEQHIYYVLHEDNTIHFGAIDMDMKPGRELQGYTHADILKIIPVFKEWGLPYGIARSTTSGFHIYFFMSSPVSAAKFRAVIYAAFERVGFMAEHRQGVRPLCELFPKAEYVSGNGLGNGIKTPMIEPRFELGRNCWVDDNNVMIPESLQWEYFAKIPHCDPATFDAIIQKEMLEVHEVTAVKGEPGATTISNRRRIGKWQQPLTGSFEKVLEGCMACRAIKARCLKGETISHNEGFALYHLAINTADGVSWFDKYSGWGKTESDKRQLEQSLDKNYAPWTCRTMQEKGVCKPGTKCLDPKPPIDIIEGEVIERKDVPRAEWKEPSPIRYSFSKGVDFLNKLIEEVKDVAQDTDRSNQSMRLKNIIARAQVFDQDQQDTLIAVMREQKLGGTKAEVKAEFRKASADKEEEFRELAVTRDDVVRCGDDLYRKLLPNGYAKVIQLGKGKEREQILCNFDIWVSEDRKYYDDGKLKACLTGGNVSINGLSFPFEADQETWSDAKKSYQFFRSIVGSEFNPKVEDMNAIKQAATEFSLKKGVEKVAYSYCQGLEGENVFFTPHVEVDASGVRPNVTRRVDLSKKQYAADINFQLLSDTEFKETLFHIKKDFIRAWPSVMSMTGLAHAMQPVLHPLLKIAVRPTLFYEGLTGSGKTELQKMLQQFYGHFQALLGFHSTEKGLMNNAYEFKDCLMVIDDYKEMDQRQKLIVEYLIQYGYDKAKRAASTRTGEAREEKFNRSLMCCSGEMFPSNEASIVARSILIEAKPRDMTGTADAFYECQKYQQWYNGITPRFICWVFNQNHQQARSNMLETVKGLQKEILGTQNADRVAGNLGYNFTTWKMFTDFLLAHGAIDEKERCDLNQEHWENILSLRTGMVLRCAEEQNGRVFLSTLIELLNSKQVAVVGLPGFDPDRVNIVGFAEPGDTNIYILPGQAIKFVKDSCRHSVLRGNSTSIGKQLVHMGIISKTRIDGRPALPKSHDGNVVDVWCIDPAKLGIKVDRNKIQMVPRAPEPEHGFI